MSVQQLLKDGYEYLRRGNYGNALQKFQDAIQIDPQRPQPHFAAAILYQEQEQYEETKRYLLQALALDPSYAPARAYLGIVLFHEHAVEEAHEELDQALLDMPTNLLVRIKYAEYYYRLGMYASSVELLEKGLRLPHSAEEHTVDVAKNLLKQARQGAEKSITRTPPDLRVGFQKLLQFCKKRD